MLFSKVGEIFTEAIPAGVLQTYAFVISPNRSFAAAGSIMISALTTGFGAALVSYGKRILCGAIALRCKARSHILTIPMPTRHGHLAK